MNLNEYQEKAAQTSGDTSIGGNTFLYPAIGIANEAGELLGKIKKIFRDNNGEMTEEKKGEIVSELGDVLWYVAETARQLNVSFGEVAQRNLDKLASRAERGKIGGSGDTR